MSGDGWLKGKQYLHKQFTVNKNFAQGKRCFSKFLNSLKMSIRQTLLALA
jgi:hypothetical protein